MPQHLSRLEELARIRSLQSRQKLDLLRKKETALKTELLRMAELQQEIHQPDERLNMMRGIGADLLWKSWIVRTRNSLMTELAQLKALMEPLISQAQVHIGQHEAAKELVLHSKRKHRSEIARKATELLIDQESQKRSSLSADSVNPSK